MSEESQKNFSGESATEESTGKNGKQDQATEEKRQYRESSDQGPAGDGAEMNFLDHLEELRWRIIKALVGVVVVGIVAYIFSDQIIVYLQTPANELENFNLQILKVPDMLMVKIKVGVFSGIIGALPIITFQLWRFIAPGLLPHEKQYVPATVIVVTICFLIGGAFGYFAILPVALKFLTQLGLTTIENNFALDAYIGFVTRMIFITGLIFELPVLSFFLTKIGLVTPAVLKHVRRFAVVLTFVLAAFFTPPDPFSMLLMGIPILLLYEISIWVSYFGLPEE
ncbi:MAG: twin-arginine translocase subunit TatC, partial [Gammaproteobacteria bacterium]|nr:twin-arginine translocase subunit TatC [candidate division Zixibacteria bacterium]NIR92654.1 twin-arginine translocase subunit TatC [Gammaproteobacteria bacterium]NIT58741.1 twin-arginine translocase subunit TatC [Fodinibius sp.]NIS47090.1 twin-arginine translocase subunit TatC [candidate division Zixibacteria bacterium]NIU13824.1 twin-arginine translocase subunit TatC [candidate division Zixibacteria bacterium]